MNRTIRILSVCVLALAASACTRITNGEVGLRKDFNGTVEPTNLGIGAHQTMVGEVMVFKIQQISADLNTIHPQASDNSSLKEFDANVIYSINPDSVYQLWTTQQRGFHGMQEADKHGGDSDAHLLMENYMLRILKNAAFTEVHKYSALELNSHRDDIQKAMMQSLETDLKSDKLDTAITLHQVLVQTMTPADSITASANALVQANNAVAIKDAQVREASKEAERIKILNSNAGAIDYMNAQSMSMIAQGVRDGKVQTIVVPADFKGMLSIGK